MKTRKDDNKNKEFENKVQEKYDECVSILENVHNAISLVLSVTDEFDDKTPMELIQFSLDQYKQFENLTDAERLKLEQETEGLVAEIKKMNPDLEIVDDRPKKNEKVPKKELMN